MRARLTITYENPIHSDYRHICCDIVEKILVDSLPLTVLPIEAPFSLGSGADAVVEPVSVAARPSTSGLRNV